MNNKDSDSNLKIPRHLALIVDGNRRWARRRGLPTFEGHRRGIENLEKIFDAAKDMGVEAVTAWVFSTENWGRSKEEVDHLFSLFREYIEKYHKKFMKEQTRFIHLGRKTKLPEDILESLSSLEEDTKEFTEHKAAFAMDYGGHDELIRAFKKIRSENLEITEENIEKCLDTAQLPPIDLIIRTSGEVRLSGFMSWQNHYSEFYFPEKPFPAFTPDDLKIAFEDFTKRDRRFGGDSRK